MSVTKNIRIVTNEDIKKYYPMVESYIRKNVIKNWSEASTARSKQNVSLGNTGFTIADIRQYLLMEIVAGLQKYNPDYRTAEGLSVKESTFIFTHLHNRGGQFLKRVTRKRSGYGFWMTQIEKALGDVKEEA
jgi:hypothetical protein